MSVAKVKGIQLTGFCEHGNHEFCRGGIRRPAQYKDKHDRVHDQDPVWRCHCDCHQGKEIVLLEDVKRERKTQRATSGEVNAERAAWIKALTDTGRLEVDIPDDKAEAHRVHSRMHNAAKAGKMSVKIRRDKEHNQFVATIK